MANQNDNLSNESKKIIAENIKKANAILQSIDATKCVKENHSCQYMDFYFNNFDGRLLFKD